MYIFTFYIFFYLLIVCKIESNECFLIDLKKINNKTIIKKSKNIIYANYNVNLLINNTNIVNIINKINTINKKKILCYSKLLRTNNILPTFLLNILGGWLTIPSYKLFLNKKFWAFSLITQLTMMNSMVINDLFDLKIDLINNNNRPLVNKEISIKEAQCLYISTNIVISLLTALFFNEKHFYKYIYTINLILFLYTPYLKKLLFIKNITCASVVSSTILLTSKSLLTLNNQFVFSFLSHKCIPYCSDYINLIDITSIFLFLSSLYIELLLDVKDINGDKENNIITIPNHFGIKKTFNFLIVLFSGNLLYYSTVFYKNKKYKLFIGFILANTHFFKNLFTLRNNKIVNDKQILNSVKETTTSLIIFIACLLLPF
jgi:4-hydroxybenzoate polyprenyltransferase